MPFILISADPNCLFEPTNSPVNQSPTSNNNWTRVTYGSSSIHSQIPELRDVGEYTHDKDTMSWTFKALPCKVLDRFERIGYVVVACAMRDDVIIWTLQQKV